MLTKSSAIPTKKKIQTRTIMTYQPSPTSNTINPFPNITNLMLSALDFEPTDFHKVMGLVKQTLSIKSHTISTLIVELRNYEHFPGSNGMLWSNATGPGDREASFDRKTIEAINNSAHFVEEINEALGMKGRLVTVCAYGTQSKWVWMDEAKGIKPLCWNNEGMR
jgi:hypothetical protein